MLAIPQKDFHLSINTNNISSEVLGDWVEASLLFHDNEVSQSDIVDILIEQQICHSNSQELAHEITASAWDELRTRESWGNAAPYLQIENQRITDTPNWRRDIVRAFFLMLSLMRIYPDWASVHRNPQNQGVLFERVVERLCPDILPGWKVFRAGWFPGTGLTIPQIVSELCERLNCRGNPNLMRWVPDQAKDGGLDLVCYRHFPDTREATPTLFIQCASGADWRSKVQTPNPVEWQKFLDSAVQPSTGIAAPFVISDEKVRLAGLKGQIIVFDRLRLLHAAYESGLTLPNELKQDLIDWLEPLVESLPKIS